MSILQMNQVTVSPIAEDQRLRERVSVPCYVPAAYYYYYINFIIIIIPKNPWARNLEKGD